MFDQSETGPWLPSYRLGPLHQDHQWDRQESHEHHQLETVDEGDGFRLRGHCLRERGASAQADDIELWA